jgi:hypothetical protein
VFGKLAKGAYILTLAIMIAIYALSPVKSSPQPEPKPDTSVEYWYC